MRRGWILAALIVASPLFAQEAPVLEAFVDGEVQNSSIRIGPTEMSATPPVLWTDEISRQGSDYIRLHLRTEGQGFADDAFVRLTSALDQSFDIPLSEIGEKGYWTDLLPLGRVRIALVSKTKPEAGALLIEEMAIQRTKGTLYSPWGENEIMPINAQEVPEAVRARSAPIAFLSFIDGGFARTCTGFLIAPDLLATNEHCINSDQTCRSMTAVFGYEFDLENRLVMGPQLRCANYDAQRTSFDFDISVIRLTRPLGPEFPPVDIAAASPSSEGPLFIIQHPGSQPKQVSFINCAARQLNVDGRAPGSDFTHTCDTAGGSSGSPVFNAEGEIVGVHHFGFMDDRDGIWTENRSARADLIATWWQDCCSVENETENPTE